MELIEHGPPGGSFLAPMAATSAGHTTVLTTIGAFRSDCLLPEGGISDLVRITPASACAKPMSPHGAPAPLGERGPSSAAGIYERLARVTHLQIRHGTPGAGAQFPEFHTSAHSAPNSQLETAIRIRPS